jgi:hypothetical protein
MDFVAEKVIKKFPTVQLLSPIILYPQTSIRLYKRGRLPRILLRMCWEVGSVAIQ